MRKGISPVIASIMLVLIVISLASSYIIFTNRISQGQQQAAGEEVERVRELTAGNFHIENVHDRTVTVVNDGSDQMDTSGLRVSIDGQRLNFTASGRIDTGENGKLRIRELWRTGSGRHELMVESSTNSDTANIRITPVEGASGHWRLDKDSGNIAPDSSGNSNDGELVNNPSWTEGKTGNGLEFDGTNSYVRVEDADTLDTPNAVTLSAWVNPSEGNVFFDGFEAGNFSMPLSDASNWELNPERWHMDVSDHDSHCGIPCDDWCGDPGIISKKDYISNGQDFCSTVNGTYSMYLRHTTRAVSPTYDLTGATSATLSGYWKGRSHDNGDEKTILQVWDGANWVKVDCIEDIGDGDIDDADCTAGDDERWHRFEVDVTSYLNSDLRFRFRGPPGSWDDTLIDNVKLEVSGTLIASSGPVILKGGNPDFATYGLWAKPSEGFGSLGSPHEHRNKNNETGVFGNLGDGWNHLTLTYEGGQKTRLYVNGELKGMIAKKGGIPVSGDELRIGQYYAGKIDEVLIYDRALPPGELYEMEEV